MSVLGTEVFISHNSKDEDAVGELLDQLQEASASNRDG